MKRIPTGPLSDRAHAALVRYADVYSLKLSEAVVDLIVLGLKVPRFVGTARPVADEIDELLDQVVPAGTAPAATERQHLGAEAHRLHGEDPNDLPWDGKTVAKGAAEMDQTPPILGYAEANKVLEGRKRAERAASKAGAQAGNLDAFFDMVEGATGAAPNPEPVPDVEPVASRDAAEEPEVPAVPLPVEGETASPYDAQSAATAPRSISVKNPVTGAMETITPDSFRPGSDTVADSAIHAALADRNVNIPEGVEYEEPDPNALRNLNMGEMFKLAAGIGVRAPRGSADMFGD